MSLQVFTRPFRNPHRVLFLLSLFGLALLQGCATTGGPVAQQPSPEGAPKVSAVLADLATSDQGLGAFQATGTCILRAPDLAAVQVLRQSSLAFAPPDRLHVIGRKYGTTVARLTSNGPAFVFEFPTERRYYHEQTGLRFDEVPFSVAPADIARELFSLEDWRRLKPAQVSVAAYDAATGEATLQIVDAAGILRRRLVVAGPPWVVLESTRFAPDGLEIAHSTFGDYRSVGEARVPYALQVNFAPEETSLELELRQVTPQARLDGELFDVSGRAAQVADHLQREYGIESGPQGNIAP